MAVNKVFLGAEELIDLTKDSVEPEAVVSGFTFHDSSGQVREGTLGEATHEKAGLMSAKDKTKLDKLPEGMMVQVNQNDATTIPSSAVVYQLNQAFAYTVLGTYGG